MAAHLLPPDIQVFERGWLSCNNVLLDDGANAAWVDTGYGTHAAQTITLAQHALGQRPLVHLVNTHVHSDHCGGNAALQAAYPLVITSIPSAGAQAVSDWSEAARGFAQFGQSCEAFGFDRLLQPGATEQWAGRAWQVFAAPGHDPHAVLLFQPDSGVLITGDALWENGFGVVFPELDGHSGFAEVASTLDLIESLRPTIVIPGHGAVFADVASALVRARTRLQSFVQDPHRHQRHAAKVLVKFKLLDCVQASYEQLHAWAAATPALQHLSRASAKPTANADQAFKTWLHEVLADLARSGAVRLDNGHIFNA